MLKSKSKKGRYANFTYQEMSCRDLLSICDQISSDVQDVEIDLFCSEPVDELWEEPICSELKSPQSEHCPCNPPAEVVPRVVPPNSPVDSKYIQQKNANPFVSYLLRIWSEQKFNSPQIDFLHDRKEELDVVDSPALVFEDPDVSHLSFGDNEEQVPRGGDADDHIVPDFGNLFTSEHEDEIGDLDVYDSQRSRILNSCVPADHIVPVRFLEE